MLGMSAEQWGYALGAGVGGVFAILLLSALFVSAYAGNTSNRARTLWIVALTGVVGIGVYSFNEGEGGFQNRITNIPEMEVAVGYSISTLIVMALFVWWRRKPQTEVAEGKKLGAGRIFAIVIAVPITLIGLGNFVGSAYVAATEGVRGSGLGVSRAEMRNIMLNGDMAPFWRVVDKQAPKEMDYVIDRLFAREDEIKNLEGARQIFNEELIDFRVSLSTYGPAMTDNQRGELLQANSELLQAFETQPELCIDVAMTGGQSLSQEQWRPRRDALNNLMVVMTENLLAAKESATAGTSVPIPPTDEDYGQLVTELLADGMPESELQALINEDPTHPDFCSAMIAFMEGAVALEGDAGEAVRFEIAQQALVAAP